MRKELPTAHLVSAGACERELGLKGPSDRGGQEGRRGSGALSGRTV